MHKHILTITKITDDEPSKQLFPIKVVTQSPELNLIFLNSHNCKKENIYKQHKLGCMGAFFAYYRSNLQARTYMQ